METSSSSVQLITRKPHEIAGSSSDSLERVRESIDRSFGQILEIQQHTREISSQGGFSAFFTKSRNIKELASHMDLASQVMQASLDLIVVLMGTSVHQKDDYDRVLELLEDIVQQFEEDCENLEEGHAYYRNIRQVLASMQERDDCINQLIDAVNQLLLFQNAQEEKDTRWEQRLQPLCEQVGTLEKDFLHQQQTENERHDQLASQQAESAAAFTAFRMQTAQQFSQAQETAAALAKQVETLHDALQESHAAQEALRAELAAQEANLAACAASGEETAQQLRRLQELSAGADKRIQRLTTLLWVAGGAGGAALLVSLLTLLL